MSVRRIRSGRLSTPAGPVSRTTRSVRGPRTIGPAGRGGGPRRLVGQPASRPEHARRTKSASRPHRHAGRAEERAKRARRRAQEGQRGRSGVTQRGSRSAAAALHNPPVEGGWPKNHDPRDPERPQAGKGPESQGPEGAHAREEHEERDARTQPPADQPPKGDRLGRFPPTGRRTGHRGRSPTGRRVPRRRCPSRRRLSRRRLSRLGRCHPAGGGPG